MISSFSGYLEEIPRIYVDNFENPKIDGARAYFLSHFHSDHVVGLGHSAMFVKLVKEENVFIYATKMTAAIIVHKYPNYKRFVKTLNLGSNLITVPGDGKDSSEYYLNVTVISAGHCLGSAMFLFETTTAKVLYTGDFRIRPNDLPKYAAFHTKDGNIIKLDALYVDTTFIDHAYQEFPKRIDSIDDAVHLMKKWLEDKNQLIKLVTSAYYGYEYIFNQIYKVLNMKVYVDAERWTFYSTIQHLVPSVTNNPEETRIFLDTPSGLASKDWKTMKFSAMKFRCWNDGPSVETNNDSYFSVCFSTHCSQLELISFVEYLQPVKVIGFPKPYNVSESAVVSPAIPLTPKKSPKKLPCQSSQPRLRNDRKVDNTLLKELLANNS